MKPCRISFSYTLNPRVACELGSPNECRCIAERGWYDSHACPRESPSMTVHVSLDCRQEQEGRMGDTASHDDHIGIEDMNERDDAGAEVRCELLHHALCQAVTVRSSLEDLLRRQCLLAQWRGR